MAFKFELRFPDGDDAGTLETAVPNWQPGDTLGGRTARSTLPEQPRRRLAG